MATVLAAPSWASAASGPQPPSARPSVTLHASKTRLPHGQNIVLSGEATGVAMGTAVHLYKAEYPYHHSKLVRTTATSATGGFSFVVHPDENVSYAVKLAGTTAQAHVRIGVRGKLAIKLKALTLGRAGVTIVMLHPRDIKWGRVRVHWSFGHGRKGRFSTHQTNHAHRLSPYVTVLSTKVTLPAGRYHWRVCFQAPRDQALLNPQRPIGCTGRGYWGRGSLPVGYPGPGAIRRAERAPGRPDRPDGVRRGRHRGQAVRRERAPNVHHRQRRQGDAAGGLPAHARRPRPAPHRLLQQLVPVSDDPRLGQQRRHPDMVDRRRLRALRRGQAAGMTDFSISGIWANAMISAADQARFFFEMDTLIPKEFVGYARSLLSGIAGYESWGIPAVARPQGYTVFFKAGWRPTNLGLPRAPDRPAARATSARSRWP